MKREGGTLAVLPVPLPRSGSGKVDLTPRRSASLCDSFGAVGPPSITAQKEAAQKAWVQESTPGWFGRYPVEIFILLPTVEEEATCDAFFERIRINEPDDFERRGLNGRIFFYAFSAIGELSTQNGSTTSHFDVWGAGAGNTSLRDR
eukprot:3516816-Amphidinium_carterae.1